MNENELLIQENYYLIVDFEATCSDRNEFPREEMEIIEIGALLLDRERLEVHSEFQSFIKPVRNPRLTEFCKDLTTIQQEQVDAAPGFTDVLKQFMAWLSDTDSYRFCSWGAYDKKQLHQDCISHRADYPFDKRHTNLKAAFAKAQNLRKPVGVNAALHRLNMRFEGIPHRGLMM
jgi:inhibitor of KinA sporulation pathway (predicted exonuclease)